MNVRRALFRMLLGRRLPQTTGTVRVSGTSGPVTIRRDGYGIPYIEAENDEDAWYGVGFCQGQDRAFQIDSMARVARGTLSELVGASGLPVDRLARQIGFSRGTAEQLDVIVPDIRRTLEAFARGVTDGMTLGTKRRAHEFVLMRGNPTTYTAADVLAVSRLQAFVLALNWDIELARYHILQMDGPEALADLDPTYPEWHPVTTPTGEAQGPVADRLASDMAALRDVIGYSGGSNNWVVSGSLTPTGRPLLANDPHLRPSLPPHWYLTHIRTPDWAVAGAAFVGVPVIPAGHNGHAAWGVTAGLVDNTDLFLEEIGPDGRSVRQGDGFVECEVLDEVIHIKGGDDVIEQVVITPRGPIVGALVGDAAMSLRATWLDPRPVEGLLTVHLVKSFADLRRACRHWPAYSLNVVYADTSGTIGWQLIGDVPQRRGGWGTLPRPGWLDDAGWEDEPLPFDRLPYAVDPPEGFLATANNSPTRDKDGPFLGVDWLDGYRVARILEMLGDGHGRDVESALKLQMDLQSIPWREMRDTVLSVSPADDDGRRALELLGDWDGELGPDSVAASVFQHFLSAMYRRVAQARAPRSWQWALGNGDNLVLPHTWLVTRRTGHLARLLRDRPDGWFAEGWDRTVADALSEALNTLTKNTHTKQAWGRVRPLTLVHPVAAEKKIFEPIFNRGPFPWGGDANTVSQAAALTEEPTANPMAVASLRMVIDVGNWEESSFVLPGGQSGNPLSPHYDDMLGMWRRGEGVPIAWSPERVESAARETLLLTPSDG